MSTAISKMTAGGSLRAIYPQSVEDTYRLAKMAFQAGLLLPLKKGYGDNAVTEEPDATLARGTMLIMQGMEIGVPPMQSLQLLAMIKGRITAHSEAVPGILLAHGCKIETWWSGTEMTDEWTCHKKLTRPNGDVYTGSYSVKDAKQAGLWDQSPTKQGYNGKVLPNDAAWFRSPKRMLNARSLGNVSKDGASDFLKGIAVREEVEDLERRMVDVTPRATPAIDAPEVPDLPDIAPAPAPPTAAEPDIPDIDQDPPIADPEGFLAKLAEDVRLCDSVEEAAEVREANADLLGRLSPHHRERAEAILNGEVE